MHFGDVLVQFKIFTATKELHKTQCCDFKIVSISEIYTLGGVDRKSMPLIIRFYSLFYFFRKSLEEERSIYRFCKMMCIFTHSLHTFLYGGGYSSAQRSKSAELMNQQVCESWARVHPMKIGAISGVIK